MSAPHCRVEKINLPGKKQTKAWAQHLHASDNAVVVLQCEPCQVVQFGCVAHVIDLNVVYCQAVLLAAG